VTRFIEPGIGNVLCGLLRNIDSSLSGQKFNEPSDLAQIAR
jgi:hypothetical protein